jgi:hypothetical protein
LCEKENILEMKSEYTQNAERVEAQTKLTRVGERHRRARGKIY